MARCRATALGLLAVLVAALAVAVTPPASGAETADPGTLPVIQIHGYDSQECPGSDASYGWAPFDHVLHEAGWTGPLLPVSFYACDTNGADITGYGPDTPTDIGTDLSPGTPRAGYRQDTPFMTIARDLAWYVYRNFSAQGQPVDIVSLSMGGLVARAALHRVQMGDPSFPPLLRVAQSITFSTPHLGFGTVTANGDDPSCHHLEQCEEWGADSALMTELVRDAPNPQAAGGTRWTVIGSSAGCDFMPLDSALGLPDALRVEFTAPCYSHIGYFWDARTELEAATVVRDGSTGTPVTNDAARYSLSFATDVLLHPPVAPQPEPDPTTEPATAPATEPTTPATTPASTPVSTPVSTAPTVPSDATVVVTPLPSVTTTAAVTVRYRPSVETGSPTVDVRYRAAIGTAAAGDWIEPVDWQGTTTRSVTTVPPTGTTQFCVSARLRGQGGPVSDWTPATCTAVATDDRAMTLSTGWTRRASARSLADTVVRARRAGATASLTVHARRIALVVTTCAGCGSVQVVVLGTVWRTVSTASTTTRRRVVLALPAWSRTRTTTVTLRTTSANSVYVDGLAALR